MIELKETVKICSGATRMEERGHEFYLGAAHRTKNELAKKVFEALAEDEARHKKVIEKYCAKIIEDKATPGLSSVMDAHQEIKKRVTFEKRGGTLLKRVKEDSDEVKAYEIALDMENDSYEYYKKALDRTSDSNTKDLYGFLLGEEKAHADLIESTLGYLKDPGAWMIREERPIVEG